MAHRCWSLEQLPVSPRECGAANDEALLSQHYSNSCPCVNLPNAMHVGFLVMTGRINMPRPSWIVRFQRVDQYAV